MANLPFPDPSEIHFGGYEDIGDAQKSAYDKMSIGGTPVPGIVEINVKTERAIDKKKSQGSPGESLTWKGWKPTNVEINVYIWAPEHFIVMQNLLERIWPPPGKDPPSSLQVISAPLNAVHINSIAVVGVSSLKPGKVAGQWLISISATEYSPVNKEKKSSRIITSKVNSTLDKNNAQAANFSTASGKQVQIPTANAKKTDPRKNPSDRAPTRRT